MALIPNVPCSIPFPIPLHPAQLRSHVDILKKAVKEEKVQRETLEVRQFTLTLACTHTHCIDHDLRQLGCVSTLVVDMYTAYMYIFAH